MKKKHIIHKVFLELNIKSKAQAFDIKDNISNFLYLDVFPSLEKQLNKLHTTLPNYAVQVDQLTLDISEKSIDLNSDLKELILTNFKQAVETIEKEHITDTKNLGNEIKTLTKQEHHLNTFIYFLKNGTTPWWISDESISFIFTPKILDAILANPIFVKQFLGIISLDEAQERFINQFTDTSIQKVYIAIIRQQKTLDKLPHDFLSKITSLNIIARKAVWKPIFNSLLEKQLINTESINHLLANHNTSTVLNKDSEVAPLQNSNHLTKPTTIETDLLKQISPSTADKTITINDPKRVLEQHIENKEDVIFTSDDHSTYNTPEGHHINNAGLVLAHPFLKHFFTHCNLLDVNNQLIDPELCAHLLHYIATGKTQQVESDMVFEKFLCNIPLMQSINRHVIITDEHKDQVKQLLNAINTNWPAMKKSTTALLQHEFLQRPGKMVFKNENTTITVEHKTQDILFKSLSWGIGLIKLPWKKDFMYANW